MIRMVGHQMQVPMDRIGKMNVEIHVTGIRAWQWRVWLMTWCLRVAGWVAPQNVTVVVKHD